MAERRLEAQTRAPEAFGLGEVPVEDPGVEHCPQTPESVVESASRLEATRAARGEAFRELDLEDELATEPEPTPA